MTSVIGIENEDKSFSEQNDDFTNITDTVTHNKILLHIDLLRTSKHDATNMKKYSTQEYNTQWKNKFNFLSNTTYSTGVTQLQKNLAYCTKWDTIDWTVFGTSKSNDW